MEDTTNFTVRRLKYLYLKVYREYPKTVKTATVLLSFFMCFELGKRAGEFVYYLIH